MKTDTLLFSFSIILVGSITYAFMFGSASNFFALIPTEPWLIFLVIDFYIIAFLFLIFYVYPKCSVKENIAWTILVCTLGAFGCIGYLLKERFFATE